MTKILEFRLRGNLPGTRLESLVEKLIGDLQGRVLRGKNYERFFLFHHHHHRHRDRHIPTMTKSHHGGNMSELRNEYGESFDDEIMPKV